MVKEVWPAFSFFHLILSENSLLTGLHVSSQNLLPLSDFGFFFI